MVKSWDLRVGWVRQTGDNFPKNSPVRKIFHRELVWWWLWNCAAGSSLESKICSWFLAFDCCFSRKMLNLLILLFDCERVLKPSGQVWGWSDWKARVIAFGISCVGIFPASWSHLDASVKNVFGETLFCEGGGFSWTAASKTASDRITLRPIRSEGINSVGRR